MARPKVKIPDRLKGERAKAYSAFCDYCRMGIGRSLRKLGDEYRARGGAKSGTEIPTQRGSTLGRWSSRYAWQDRVEEYDLLMQEARQADIEKEALTGLATPKNRIHELKKLANDLARMIYTEDDGFEISHPGRRPFLWVRDTKMMGSGPLAYPVDLYRYNSPLIGDFRGLLDDIAHEVGGRRQVIDISTEQKISLSDALGELENLTPEELAARYRDIAHQRAD